ncbi:MAG: HlyC/CorC family transporter [Lachnospiraceae bacterium]|nr:HlyC/CorC family transporter [Lachnospiraceae bacterium]
MDPAVLKLIVLVILILLSAFFSSAETSLMSANKIKMRSLSESGNKPAEIVLKLNEKSGKMLSAILIGNNVVNLSASSLATILAQEKFQSVPISIVTGILTITVLIFGEIVPKTVATIKADTMALIYAPVINALCFILTPVIFIMDKFSRVIMFIIRIDPNKKTVTMTEDEFLTVVDVTHEEGVIESEEREMIENVVVFGDSLAKDIMVPRIDVEFVEDNESYEDIVKKFRESNFSRLPVYHETNDNVVGVLFLKDLFSLTDDKNFNVEKVMRKPYFTFEFKKTADLLSEMRQHKLSIAVVLDEYGATAGIITIEDLLEEIVGELRDEYDSDEEDLIKKISDTEYVVDGSTKLDDINEVLELSVESDDYDSIAGHIIHLLEHIPEAGEEATDDKARYVVDSVDKNRIDKIHVFITVETNEEDRN